MLSKSLKNLSKNQQHLQLFNRAAYVPNCLFSNNLRDPKTKQIQLFTSKEEVLMGRDTVFKDEPRLDKVVSLAFDKKITLNQYISEIFDVKQGLLNQSNTSPNR